MEKLSYLEQGRKLLRSIRNQRRWCISHNKSYLETDFARRELNNLDGALSTITSAHQMQRYLERKEAIIRLLMPGKNVKNHNKLRELLESEL
jgi:hypothetical protein